MQNFMHRSRYFALAMSGMFVNSSNAYAEDNPALQPSSRGASVEQGLGVPPLPYHDLPTQGSTALIPGIKVFRQNCYYHLSGIPSNFLGFLRPVYFLAVPILCSSQVMSHDCISLSRAANH